MILDRESEFSAILLFGLWAELLLSGLCGLEHDVRVAIAIELGGGIGCGL